MRNWCVTCCWCLLCGLLLSGCKKELKTVRPEKTADAATADAQQTGADLPAAQNNRSEDSAGLAAAKDPEAFAKFAVALAETEGCYYDSVSPDMAVDLVSSMWHDSITCPSPLQKNNRLRALVSEGGNIDALDEDGQSLLFYSMYRPSDVESTGESHYFGFLLDAGADITRPDGDGTTVLMKTFFSDTARMYIAAGGSLDAVDKNGDTALLIKMRQKFDMAFGIDDGDGHYVDYFYEEGSMNCMDENADRCVTYADLMRDEMAGVIREIVRAGADVNIRNRDGETALFYVGHVPFLELLLDAGADVSIKNNRGQTALDVWTEKHRRIGQFRDRTPPDIDGLKAVFENAQRK